MDPLDVAGLEQRSAASRPTVFHCWRGGLRSRAVVALLRASGHDGTQGSGEAFVLEGGYKAYRAEVRRTIEVWDAPPAFALRGLTGVGKTLVLRELERLRPGWTFDLEAQAGHRSSLLGMVGLEPVSQKRFESRIAGRIREGFPGPVVFEGESRRVGDSIIPASVWSALQGATDIELRASPATRVRVLIADYLADEANREPLRRQLIEVESRMQGRFDLKRLLDDGREEELVALLLEHYYDPLYRHSERERNYALSLASDDPRSTAQQIATWIAER